MAAAAAIVVIARHQPGVLCILAAGVLAAGFVARRPMTAHDKRAAVLAVMVAVSTGDYLAWRFGVINWQAPWLSIPLYAAEVFAAIHIVGFHYTLWPREAVPSKHDEDPTTRPIFIFVPTVDEGADIVRETLHGALATQRRYLEEHPGARVEIVVCNDGGAAGSTCSPDIERLCASLGIRCITRAVGGGAKAGNLEHARRLVGATGDALIVIFDADQVASPDFLLATIPKFADSGIAWVQTGQYYRNLENPVARWAHDQQAIFYRVLCEGKAAVNAAFICGTNVVIRAAALDEIGGFPQDSVTEDFAASIVLHERWRSAFVSGELAHGLGPLELSSYLGQQRRWARGSLGILRRRWRDIFLPKRGGLHAEQRAQYALACTHYLSGVRDLVYVVVPIVFLVTGIAAVRGADLAQFFTHFVTWWVLAQVAFWHAARGKTSWRGIVLGFGSFGALVVAAVRGLVLGDGRFTITPKHRVGTSTVRHIAFHVVCLVACVAAIVIAIFRGGGVAVLISAVWVMYTGVLLGAFVGLAFADRAAARGVVRAPRADRTRARPMRVRPAFTAALTVVALVAGFAAFGRLGHRAAPAGATVTDGVVGLDFSTDLVPATTTTARALGCSVGLIARTQEITDHFDTQWARRARELGATPWVTLVFSAANRPSYDAGLLSVANGVHDGEVRRWAREIRAWGRPVDLTVLPQVDRNWAVSSAVANGGVPADSARAWNRVQSVFRAAGATNVTWVWAPADPADDQQYAPAAQSFGAVALSFIEYPDAKWVDPRVVIGRVEFAHPGVPIFVETSLAGPVSRRVHWLAQLGAAVRETSAVAAVVYHEGGPMPVATPAQRDAWSLRGDERVRAAFAAAAGRFCDAPGTPR